MKRKTMRQRSWMLALFMVLYCCIGCQSNLLNTKFHGTWRAVPLGKNGKPIPHRSNRRTFIFKKAGKLKSTMHTHDGVNLLALGLGKWRIETNLLSLQLWVQDPPSRKPKLIKLQAFYQFKGKNLLLTNLHNKESFLLVRMEK